MSIEAYARTANRENTVWPSFLYPINVSDGQAVERAIIFGLYASSYSNSKNYLDDLEAFELTNLLSDYTIKIAGLTNDEQIILNQLAAKLYLANVEVAISDNKLNTQQLKVNSDSAEMDAKIASLDADRASLTTLITHLSTETKNTAARIDVLEAEILMEDANLSLTDIETHEKEIVLAKTNLDVLRVASDVAKIQLQVVEAGVALVEMDVQKSEVGTRIANTKLDTMRTGLTAKELQITQAQHDVSSKELLVDEKEVEITQENKLNVVAENAYLTAMKAVEQAIALDRVNHRNVQTETTIAEIEKRVDATEVHNEFRMGQKSIDTANIDADGDIRSAEVTNRVSINTTQIANATSAYEAALYAEYQLTHANVASTLRHTIGASS
jgi:hypothetical protein